MAIQRSGPVDGSPAEAAIFLCALMYGPIARVDIARRAGLSSAAVTRASRGLLDSGYLIAVDERPGAPAHRLGRPTSPLQVNALHTGAFGVKITGDEVVGVVCDLAGEIRASDTVALENNHEVTVLAAVRAVIDHLRERTAGIGFTIEPSYLGVSLSGDIDHEAGRVRYSPFLSWRDVELGALLGAELAMDVVIENDVRALASSEQWFGLGRGVDDFAMLTIGAGIGCALVVGGALVRGAHSVAGEIGHLPLGDRSIRCHCGGWGCVEAVASTTALVTACREATGLADLTEEQMVKLAREGDERVTAIFARAGHILGLAIASVANLLGPQQVVVAGEAVSRYDLFESAIRDAFAEQAFGAALDMSILVRDLPFDEWARGAATRAIEELVFPARSGAASRTHSIGATHV